MFGISHQQLRTRRSDNRQTIQVPMAGGIILQMDQTTLADQNLFRHVRERRQDAGLDSGLRLRARGDREEGTQGRSEHDGNFANIEPPNFRENRAFYGTFE